jgi:hypothetical protein
VRYIRRRKGARSERFDIRVCEVMVTMNSCVTFVGSLAAIQYCGVLVQWIGELAVLVQFIRDILRMIEWAFCALLYASVATIRTCRLHPCRYPYRQGIGYTIVLIATRMASMYQQYVGKGAEVGLAVLLGHMLIGAIGVSIPSGGPGLVLLLGTFALRLRNDSLRDGPIIGTNRQEASHMGTKGGKVWFKRDKVERIRRTMIETHRMDRGHRTVSRARFGRAVRIVRKEMSAYAGAHLRSKWGSLFREKNVWLRHRRRALGKDLMRAVRKLKSGRVCTFGAEGGGGI